MEKEESLALKLLPWWMYVVLALFVVAGFCLIYFNPKACQQVTKLSGRVRPDAWSIFLGILSLSFAITHLIVFFACWRVRVLLRLKGNPTLADLWAPALVGFCESIMYPMALFLRKPEFIGVWLAVKVAGEWVRWKGEAGDEDKLNEGRRRYTASLIGNALSIMLGTVTWGAWKVWALS